MELSASALANFKSYASLRTKAVHAGRSQFASLGVHAPPIDLSTTYPFTDLNEAGASLDHLVEGHASAPNPVYARLYNPTTARFEEALAELEDAEAAVAYSSGMAALTAVLLAVSAEAKHVVAVRPIYGTSDHLLNSGLLPIESTWTTADTIAGAIRPDTGLVMIETPANPTMKLVDIRACVQQAGDIPVLVDSTFATPVLQQPLKQGAAMVLHSATKYLGGHGDVIAGVVATSEAWAARLRQIRIVTGALLHPLAAYLLHRGLPTLPLRVRAAQESAQELVQRLKSYPSIKRVYHPGLEADEADLLRRQMNGSGTMLAFDIEGGYEAAASVLRHVKMMTPAVSLGSVDTLIQHPAGLTHRVVSKEGLAEGGISDGLIRLSVGLEDVDDIWYDLVQAIDAAIEQTRPLKIRV